MAISAFQTSLYAGALLAMGLAGVVIFAVIFDAILTLKDKLDEKKKERRNKK